jgi:hypothetical protein
LGTLELLPPTWWPEDHLDLVLSTTRERKVRTTEEREAAIKEPMRVAELETFGFTGAWRMWRGGWGIAPDITSVQ